MDNITERIKMIKAMEYIARQINDETILGGWLMTGVADGDIEYGDLEATVEDVDRLYGYLDDQEFAELMGCFMRRIREAYKSGGLYCGGVVSEG